MTKRLPLLFVPLAATLALTGCAAAMGQRQDQPPPDLGAITLPLADPTVAATIAGTPATLAVSLDARDTIELAPALANRVDVPWQRRETGEIGRVSLPSRLGAALVAIGGVSQPLPLTTYDRPCCAGHDGEIGPLLLPWSSIHLVGANAGTQPPERRFPAEFTPMSGLYVPFASPRGSIHLILSPRADQTIATASAAAILAQLYGGHFVGAARMAPIAFGIEREVRDMRFDRPFTLLGLPVTSIAVRIADYGGGRALPQDQQSGGDIVVRHRGLPPQHDWPAVSLGRDLLDRCTALSVYRAGPELGLACPAG